MTSTPVSLLARLQQSADDRDAWNEFAELYTPFLYHWARRVGASGADAEDLVQDVFVVLVRKMPHFAYDRDGSFRAWLRTVTRNKWQERRRRAELPREPGVPVDPPDPADQDAVWEDEYRKHVIARALENLRDDFQPASWRACWEVVAQGRPAAAVAAELGLTVGAVYAAKFRVLARLREELDGLID